MKEKDLTDEIDQELLALLPLNCRFWKLSLLKDYSKQRKALVKKYNSTSHELQPYYKYIKCLKLK